MGLDSCGMTSATTVRKRTRDMGAESEADGYSIVRVDTVNAKGIPVHLWTTSIKRQGVDIVRHFYDGVYGDKQSALVVAKAYRDAVMRLFPPRTQREQSVRLRSSNTSGIAGVRAVHKGGKLVAWLATLSIGQQKPLRRYFAVKNFGAERAKELAIAARQELLREFPDRFATVHPRATATANEYFGHLIDPRQRVEHIEATALDAAELNRRYEMLNAWFDALKPRHVHVRISIYSVHERGHDAVLAIVSNGGPPSQLKRRTWSLLRAQWQDRRDEVWGYVRDSLNELLGARAAREFVLRHQHAFFAADLSIGFVLRQRLEEPALDYLRSSPPLELMPMLEGFSVPPLPPLHTVSI